MTAFKLAEAGIRVLVMERGRWADRDDSAWDTKAIHIDRKYRSKTPFETNRLLGPALQYPNETVGGQSVFYGAASFRLRQADFQRLSSAAGVPPSGASFVDWPISYGDLAAYYDQAEQMLGVVGVAGVDPTEPPRQSDYVAAPPSYGSPAKRVAEAARQLDLQPFPIPLAINFNGRDGRKQCIQCMTCDLFPCKIGAKNDLSVTILPEAIRLGAVVQDQTVATRLVRSDGRITGVECLDLVTGETSAVTCDLAVVSAGAISSAKLLLASGLGNVRPNGPLIGRYLMRHCSGIVSGLFRSMTNPEQLFHKQLAITDFYFGHPNGGRPSGPWGMIQGLQVPPPEFMKTGPLPVAVIGPLTLTRQIFLICIAEDIPSFENRVTLHTTKRDSFGQLIAKVRYKHHRRDLQGRRALYREAARILRKAGAVARVRIPISTFSHAMGTCRFGTDPANAVLDPMCRFWGIPNLFVVDASFMPTSAAVNPSLTIAANALRVGEHIVDHWDAAAGSHAK